MDRKDVVIARLEKQIVTLQGINEGLSGIKEKPIYKSKKFYAVLVAALVPILNSILGLDLDVTEWGVVTASALSLAFAQGLADIGKNRKV